MKRRSIVNFSCGLCERPVTGVHFLWDNATGREATVWLHGDEEEDQCFTSVARDDHEVSYKSTEDKT